MTERGRVRIGTSGWVYRHWRGVFYPPHLRIADWFPYYARDFDTVEINNTFYRLPSEEAVTLWRDQAPPDFVYAVKASRFLTHRKKLKEPEEPLDTILGRVRILVDHLGPVLYQLPPNWGRNVERLRQFIRLLPHDLSHVFEFRDPSWFDDDVRGLLAEAGAGFCVHDMPGSACPNWVTSRTIYLRFHGPGERRYAGRYDRGRLRDWAAWIDGHRRAGRDVFAYFNNDEAGHAVVNAQELREELGDERPAGKGSGIRGRSLPPDAPSVRPLPLKIPSPQESER